MKSLNIDGVEGTHPLDRTIHTIDSWTEWMQMWEAARTAEEMISLLHYGFSKFRTKLTTDHDERIIFYLQVANGWMDRWEIGDEKHRGRVHFHKESMTAGEIRREVSTKAFLMLHDGFFKDETPRREHDEELYTPSPALLSALMAFFRVTASHRIENLPSNEWMKHEIRSRFLIGIATYVWNWRPIEIGPHYGRARADELEQQNEAVEEIMPDLLVWLVHLVSNLGRRDLLWGRRETITDPELEELRKMALSRSLHDSIEFGRTAYPENLEEAVTTGSHSATLLLKLVAYKAGMASITRRKAQHKEVQAALEVLKNAGRTVPA